MLLEKSNKISIGRPHIYSCNDDFFSGALHERSAYWLGFIAADGSITPNLCKLRFALQEKDSCMVEMLRDDLQATNPIRTFQNGKNKASEIVIASRKIVSDLSFYGIT